MNAELYLTRDGSHTLIVPELNETYHSTFGALSETNYVYVNQGLEFAIQKDNLQTVKVLEFGFGTGLNALASFEFALKHSSINIDYHTVEKFPISSDLVNQLNFKHLFDSQEVKGAYQLMHDCKWEDVVKIGTNFQFHKYQTDFLDLKVENNSFDVLYYDAFAPSKQAEVWSLEYLQKAYNVLKMNGVLITYCSNGTFKRNIKSLGFELESLPGPNGKKEITRAIKK